MYVRFIIFPLPTVLKYLLFLLIIHAHVCFIAAPTTSIPVANTGSKSPTIIPSVTTIITLDTTIMGKCDTMYS